MNLLLTGAWSDAGKYISELEELGHSVVFMQNESDALPCDPGWVEGVVCNGLFLSHDPDDFVSLRYVQLTSAGFDRIPLDDFRKRGIAVYNARGVYSIPMAEHAVAAVLYFFRHGKRFFEQQKQRLWKKDRGLRELAGSTVCIIGCGSVGTECAKRFTAFGCTVIGVDIDASQKQDFGMIFPLEELYRSISSADIVILTLPLTDSTRGLADDRFFESLKDACVLVNISRGAIVDTDALIKALSERELYAAPDVFEEEPLDELSPLWSMENVLVTPHNSFVSDKTAGRLSALILEGIKRRAGGDTLEDSGSISQE